MCGDIFCEISTNFPKQPRYLNIRSYTKESRTFKDVGLINKKRLNFAYRI